ncbi:hypothetical protein Tco_0158522 [Tanacetum coccineum]
MSWTCILPRVVAIDSSEANGIIRDPKLELENSRFTFDLVPLSYESVDVVVGENWLLRHKAEWSMPREGQVPSMKANVDVVKPECSKEEGVKPLMSSEIYDVRMKPELGNVYGGGKSHLWRSCITFGKKDS